MNFDDAIRAHANWKMKLTAYLNRPDRTLDPKVVGSDAECQLGKWLKAEAGKPELQDLATLHTQFHREAARLVQRADAGERVGAEAALGASSPYGTVSAKLVKRLAELKAKA